METRDIILTTKTKPAWDIIALELFFFFFMEQSWKCEYKGLQRVMTIYKSPAGANVSGSLKKILKEYIE